MDKLSFRYYDGGSTYTEDDVVAVTDGMDQIPKRIMAKAQKMGASLLLNFVVTSIAASFTGVTVTGTDGSGVTRSFAADHVIVTVPLGVLKAGSITFSPALSSAKQEAITHAGFGTVNKVAFFYEKPFWASNASEFFIEDASLPANRGRFVDWVNLEAPWKQHALMGVSAGEYADAMAGLTEAQVVAEAKAKMLAMFPSGQSGVTLRDTFVQRWNVDPYALGSYSFVQQGYLNMDDPYEVLAEREGRLLFAGEHTDRMHGGTVYGAYTSGIDQAQKIMRGG